MAGAPTPSFVPSVFDSSGDPENILVLLRCDPDPITGQANDQICYNGYNSEDPNWFKLPDPQNVLILPDLRKPIGPLVAQGDKGIVKEISIQSDCTGAFNPVNPNQTTCCYAHDSVSGWWVQFSFGCDPVCTPDSAQAQAGLCDPFGGCLEGRLPCSSHPHFDQDGVEDFYYLTGEDIDTYLALMPPEYQIPAWASGGEAPVWDAWMQACCGGAQQLTNLTDNQNPPPPPPSCPVGFHAPPCLDGECFSADGCCGPCDPPLPYNNAGPLIGGGIGGGLGGINQDAIFYPLTPLSTPLPTQSIAVTACKECQVDDEEILVTDLE